MDRKISERIQFIIIIILGLTIAGILFYMIPYRYNLNTVVSYEVDYNYIDNPLMGFAPMADNALYSQNAKLVYINLTWADWEPEKGKYDIDGLEKRNNIERWKKENKHAVIRFVCDVPSDKPHKDIPEWLYSLTGDGVEYSNECGMGYSPNYENTQFIGLHEEALVALAEYCKKDDFVSFVELGSIGHWGEWHALDSKGKNIMPDSEICLAYANQYSDNFTEQVLLTRRNYDFAVDNGIGTFNDMIGSNEDTQEWLEWLGKEDTQETSGGALKLKPVKNLGMKAPIGGEFTSSIPMESMLGNGIGEVLSQISASNMTFIGPNVPDLTDKSTEINRQSILRRMGYRIYVSKLETKYDFSKSSLDVNLTWKNDGFAGFFFNWPVSLNVYDKDKNLIYWETLDLDLRDLNDGKEKLVSLTIPYSDEIKDEFYFGIEISNYTSDEFLNIATKMEDDLGFIDNSRIIYHYDRK